MGPLIFLILAAAVIVGALLWSSKQRAAAQRRELDDAKAEARRWTERLGGQVFNLVGTNDAAKQALVDASERHGAAVSQLDQANSVEQARLVKETAIEGLHYVRAARVAMDMDPGPAVPDPSGSQNAGKVTEARQVDVDGKEYAASPDPSAETPHYYPGGRIAGRPVPQGWYSEPWWKSALIGGAWGVGAFALTEALFGGMSGVPSDAYAEGVHDGMLHDGQQGFDGFGAGGFDGGGFDNAGDFGGLGDFGDFGGDGFDFGGNDGGFF